MRRPWRVGILLGELLAVALMSQALLAVPASSSAQWYRRQPGIFPVFDGWETSPDGSHLLYFGYMNRHPREVTVSIGSENRFQPGRVDRGQPTNFLPGRQQHVFTVTVPADFTDKLVWSLTSEVGVQHANGSLNQLYMLEQVEEGDPGAHVEPPQLTMVEPDLTAQVAGTLQLRPQIQIAASGAPERVGEASAGAGQLTVWWSKYRGPGTVTFAAAEDAGPGRPAGPEGTEPGTFSVSCAVPPEPVCGATNAQFTEPGTYVLRLLARRRRATRAPVAQFVDRTATVRVTVNP